MNEELKIIITAATEGAKKGIKDIKSELGGVSKSAKGASKGIGAAMKGVAIGAAAAIGAIVAVGAALVKLGKASLDFQKAQAKLNTAFQSMGSTAKQAAESYNGLFRFLGDTDKSAEAAAHLAKLTTNQKELAEWTKVCQGIYATFGDSLPIEGLTEAANETARVGQVTGTLADALNWAGVSEDEFNAKLAKCTSYSEREALIRSTLNGLYTDAAEIYEKNNKKLIEYNESQARLDASMASAGQACIPLMTALNNLAAVLFDALKPAIDVIVPALAQLVNWLSQGIQAVMGLFGAVTGASASINSFASASSGIGDAAGSAGDLAAGFDDAAKAAEKAKKATMGFDELNIVSSGSSSGGDSGSSGPGYMAPQVGAQNFTMEVEQTEGKASGLAETMKKVAAELKDVFAPTIEAWTSGFETIKESWNSAKPHFIQGGKDIINAFKELGGYVVGTLVPDLVNSFSTNLAPMITDVFGWRLEQAGKNFEMLGGVINDAVSTIIIPAFEAIKTTVTDTFSYIGEAWAQHGEPLLEKASKACDHIRQTFVNLYEQFLKPICDKIIAVFKQVWENGLGPMTKKFVDAVMEIGECLLQLYNEFIAPIVDWIVANIVPIIKNYLERLIEHIGKVVTFIANAIGGVIDVIKGIVQFITGVFTGDWEKAWEGIKNIFSGIWEAIKNIALAAWEGIKYPFQEAGAFFGDIWELIKSIFAGVAEWFSGIFSAAWEGIKSAWSAVVDWFAGIWQGICDAFASVGQWFADIFTAAWNGICEAWSGVTQWFSDLWDSIVEIFSGVADWFTGIFTSAWEGIKSAWSGVTQWFSDIWSNISTTFSNVGGWFSEKFQAARTGVNNAFSTVGSWFSEKWTGIKNTFAPAGEWFSSKFQSARTSVNNAFSSVGSWFGSRWSDIKSSLSSVGSWFSDTFSKAYTNTTNAFKNAKTGFSNVWSNIKSGFGNVSDWFKNTFTNAWTAVKNVFSSGGKIFDGIKDGILSGLKSVINKIIEGINKVIAVPFNGINSALKSIKNVEIVGIKPFSWLPTISVPQIPKLARGGIVDQATLALIGERGKEAVVPLENNTEWIDKLVERLTSRQQAPSKIVLMLDGKELGWANINSINNITRQTGALQLQLV
jgi:phage-related protein